jgi:hypothetical protein
MLVGCGGGSGTPTTKTYTSANNGQTVTLPVQVTNLLMVSGQGAAGSPATDQWTPYYSKKTSVNNQRNDLGGEVFVTDGGTTYHYGATPNDYCDPANPYIMNGVTNYTRTCYDFTDLSYTSTNPATTGASATGFGKTFPGGVGGPATVTKFDNVAITGGQPSAPLNIPAGASITISYYE